MYSTSADLLFLDICFLSVITFWSLRIWLKTAEIDIMLFEYRVSLLGSCSMTSPSDKRNVMVDWLLIILSALHFKPWI